ncbi:MAG TPA: hypothetical protein VMF88_10530 [Bacteroidota bacterium]|nr:hypothetical protein [Bacteroidota bacterium]
MISSKRLEQLKILFQEDGIDASDEALVQTGQWLLERAKTACAFIPSDKQSIFQNIVEEMEVFRGLHKKETVRDNPKNTCRETSNN